MSDVKVLVLGSGDAKAGVRAGIAWVAAFEGIGIAALQASHTAPWNMVVAAAFAGAALHASIFALRNRRALAHPKVAQAAANLDSLGEDYALVVGASVDGEPIDMILVGPHGALVLEPKDQSCQYLVDGDEWRLAEEGRAPFLVVSPNLSLRRRMQALALYYAKHRISATVSGAVVVSPDTQIEFGQRSVPVVAWDGLAAFVLGLPSGASPGQDRVLIQERPVVAGSSSRLRHAGSLGQASNAPRESHQTA